MVVDNRISKERRRPRRSFFLPLLSLFLAAGPLFAPDKDKPTCPGFVERLVARFTRISPLPAGIRDKEKAATALYAKFKALKPYYDFLRKLDSLELNGTMLPNDVEAIGKKTIEGTQVSVHINWTEGRLGGASDIGFRIHVQNDTKPLSFQKFKEFVETACIKEGIPFHDIEYLSHNNGRETDLAFTASVPYVRNGGEGLARAMRAYQTAIERVERNPEILYSPSP